MQTNSVLLAYKKQHVYFGLIGPLGSRIETQQSKIESRFLTRFSILDSREDRESSVNLLLNGTVPPTFAIIIHIPHPLLPCI